MTRNPILQAQKDLLKVSPSIRRKDGIPFRQELTSRSRTPRFLSRESIQL